MNVVESEYKGFPILEIPIGSSGRSKFSFGLSKAQAILLHVQDIQAFVSRYEKEIEAKDIYKFAGEAEFVKYCEKHGLDELKLKSQIRGSS